MSTENIRRLQASETTNKIIYKEDLHYGSKCIRTERKICRALRRQQRGQSLLCTWTFEKRGYHLDRGADLLFYGDIPAGSGLSSSASLEVLTGLMLRDTFGFDISMVDLALIGQYSENHFNGMNCGIMDQFASAMGRKDCAIFLDTNTLQYEYAPVKLPDAKLSLPTAMSSTA